MYTRFYSCYETYMYKRAYRVHFLHPDMYMHAQHRLCACGRERVGFCALDSYWSLAAASKVSVRSGPSSHSKLKRLEYSIVCTSLAISTSYYYATCALTLNKLDTEST